MQKNIVHEFSMSRFLINLKWSCTTVRKSMSSKQGIKWKLANGIIVVPSSPKSTRACEALGFGLVKKIFIEPLKACDTL